MPVYETLTAEAFTPNWKGEIAVRVNDILRRRKDQFSDRLEEISRFIERGLGKALPSESLKSSIKSLVRSLRKRQGEIDAGGEPVLAELDVFFEQIVRCRDDNQIEQYSTYLFKVEMDLKI